MNDIRKLLVIVNPEFRDDYVLVRARQVAQAFQPEIELVVSESGAEAAREHFADLDVTVNVQVAAQPLDFDTILGRIRAFSPDLTLKSIRRRHPLARLLVTNTDWKLVVHIPTPLWLVKSSEWFDNGCILASVDPLHSKAQQNELDHLLLDTASTLASHLNQQIRIFHCYFPDMASMFPKVLDASDYLMKTRAEHQSKLETLLERHHMDMSHVIMARGDLIRTLNKAIRKEQANLLVLGALSRNVVERAIVGSTTERMLNESRSDVLVMKSSAQQRTP